MKDKKNNGKKMIVSLNDQIVEFREEMNIGISSIKKAAKIYADALLRHPTEAAGRFAEQFPDVSANTWDMLERIGNGDLHEKAFLLPYATVERIAHLPIKKQEVMFDRSAKGYEVVNPSTLKTRVIPLASLSSHQANILFDTDAGKVRTVEEQRSLIRDRSDGIIATGGSGNGRPPKYRICGNVVFIAGVEIGRETLKRILSEMEDEK